MYDFENVKTNAHGLNLKIKWNNDVTEDTLLAAGFRFMEEPNYPEKWSIPPHWHYHRDMRKNDITFNVDYYIDPYKGNTEADKLDISVIDEDFGQPYDYQYLMRQEKVPGFVWQVKDFVENEMSKLQEAGIISGHIEGEYI